MFMHPWNALIHVCGERARLDWLETTPMPARADTRALFAGDEVPDERRIASIPKVALWAYPANVAANVDTLVRIHDADTLKAVGQVALPPFPSRDGVPHVSHGRWVFSSATMDRLFVVVREDPDGDFAIVTVDP